MHTFPFKNIAEPFNKGMKILFLVLLHQAFLQSAYAQPFGIGTADATWNDPDRANRAVVLKIYYPAVTGGANATPATGNFPTVVFGHGFVMGYGDYRNLWEYYVPKGYIFVMVDMENGISPSHEAFGRDILFAGKTFKQKSEQETAFLLYQKHNGKTAFAGHSMGGGATVLAASYEPSFPDAVVGLAAAETNPSAVAAAPAVTAPYIIFSGTGDAVTPPAGHHIPIYNAVGSECKTIVNITGGAHCYFANSSITCDFGESTSGSNATITRAVQQNITNSILEPFFAIYLKSDNSQQGTYQAAVGQSTLVVSTNCVISNASMDDHGDVNTNIYPNPSSGEVIFENLSSEIKSAKVISLSGISYFLPISNGVLQLDWLPSGMYFIQAGEKTYRLLLNK